MSGQSAQQSPARSSLRHYAGHVDWYALGVLYALFTWGLWDNPRWWAAALLAPVIPVLIALRGHLLCSIQYDCAQESNPPAVCS